jgi:hypothetical protein
MESLRDHGLNLAAWAALLVLPPLRASRVVARLASFGPPLESGAEARRALDALGPVGTCLSRAISVAVRLPGAEVVIGVSSGLNERSDRPISAHAWIAVGESSFHAQSEDWVEIARLSFSERSAGAASASGWPHVADGSVDAGRPYGHGKKWWRGVGGELE